MLCRMGLLNIVLLSLSPLLVLAGDVEIKQVELQSNAKANDWTFHVTLKHADSGWQHYADAWRIVDKNGKELGKRVLLHPHVNEQPFTRSLSAVKLEGAAIIYVQAHDKLHGWSKDRVEINLNVIKGERYRIGR